MMSENLNPEGFVSDSSRKLERTATVREVLNDGSFPPPSHAWGFCPIPSDIDDGSNQDFIIFDGCVWNQKKGQSGVYEMLHRYSSSRGIFIPFVPEKRYSPRYRHTIVYRNPKPESESEKQKEYLVCFGGVVGRSFQFGNGGPTFYLEDYSNELISYSFESNSWGKLSFKGDVPRPLAFHKALYQRETDSMWIFGGKDKEKNRTNQMWVCSFKDESWKEVKYIKKESEESEGEEDEEEKKKKNSDIVIPPSRGGHSLHWLDESKQEEILVYGGISSDHVSVKEVYVYSCLENKWRVLEIKDNRSTTITTRLKEPRGRASHDSVVYRNKLYVFGGASAGKPGDEEFEFFNDLWCLDLKTKIWTEIHVKGCDVPGGTYIHRCVVVKDKKFVKILIFGGITEKCMSSNKLYEIELESLMEEEEFIGKDKEINISSQIQSQDDVKNVVAFYGRNGKVEVSSCRFRRKLFFCDLYKDVLVTCQF